uniref:Maestro heat like repeat family member 2A n=1 Tax=Ornithorhynchus anatinus TaxID=9258 RepID=F6XMZ9_ORNAN
MDEDEQENLSSNSQADQEPKMRKTLASMIIIQKANANPTAVMAALIHSLQLEEVSQRKESIYIILQDIIHQEGELDDETVQALVVLASKELRMTQIEASELAECASATLVALSRNHFSIVMYELQHHLKPLVLADEFILTTLANLANANVFEFMPYMGITLATILSTLRLADGSKIRQVLCSAMEAFCEAIQFYLKHWEDSIYPIMTDEHFMNKLLPVYRHFITDWLRSEDAEVKLAVIKSLRPMLSLLLPIPELREQVYDYTPLLLAEYQGSIEWAMDPSGWILRQILEVSVATKMPVPRIQLHTIFTELHIQVCSKAPTFQQFSSENLAEVVQCFIVLARSYPMDLMRFFRHQMQTGKEAIRVGTLTLLRAVICADGDNRTLHLAVKVIKNGLCDPRAKVKVAILRVIGQLAISGHQERVRGWGLRYVSLQLILSTYKMMNCQESSSLADLEEKMVHKITMETVQHITASVSGVINEFWLKLLGYIMETEYTEALTPICISLTNLAERQSRERTLDTDCGRRGQVELPAPHKLLARLLVLLSAPYKGEGRGVAMLHLLKVLFPSIAPSMAGLWEVEIPVLTQYLEAHSQYTWNQDIWEDKLVKFLKVSLKRTQGTTWSLRLSRELNHQIGYYETPSVEKAFLYRALGYTLAAGHEAEKVEIQLMDLLSSPTSLFILCLGLCARGQVITVLNVLQEFEEKIQEAEDSWHMSAWRSDHPWRREVLKSALIAMYSSVVAHCHPKMLLSRVENKITKKILHHYATSCQVIITSACWVLSTHLTSSNVLGTVLNLTLVLPCLSKLKPLHSPEEIYELMDKSLQCVFPLPPQEQYSEQIKILYDSSMNALMQLMECLLERVLDPKGLQETFHLLEKWLHSEKDWERERAVMLSLHLLQVYREGIVPLKSGQFGTLIGLFAPHTCDSRPQTRQTTMDVIHCLLDLQGEEQKTPCWFFKFAEKEFLDIKEELTSKDVKMIYAASSKIAKVVIKEAHSEEIMVLIQSTCESLGATNTTHDKAAVTWLNSILRLRVQELEDKVPEILSAILAHLPLILTRDVQHLIMEAVVLLAHSYQETVLTCLLRQPLPLDRHITELWEALAEDVTLAQKILQALVARIQERARPKSSPASRMDIWRLAAVDPLTAVCALHVMAGSLDSRDCLQEVYPELIYTILQELSGTHQSDCSSPRLHTWRCHMFFSLCRAVGCWCHPTYLFCLRLTIEALQGLLSKVGNQEIMRALTDQGVWSLLEDPRTYVDGICLLAGAMNWPRFTQLLLSSLDSDSVSWSISGTAFFTELMCDSELHKKKLLKPVILKLSKGAGHENSTLRLLSVRALGNLAIGAPHKVKKYRKLLLKVLLAALIDPVSPKVAYEGMIALTKILGLLKEEQVGVSFETISKQCRAFFDDENDTLRLQAFILFGKLAVLARRKKRDAFATEMQKSWVPLLLHLQDPSPEVAKVR